MLKPIAIVAAFALAFAYPAVADEAPPPAAQTETAAVADDVPQTVKDACKDDYEKNCKQHAPESNEVRECMARAFEKLSDGCVTAILDSSLADQAMPTEDAATPRQVVHRTAQVQGLAKDKRKHATVARRSPVGSRANQGRRIAHAKPRVVKSVKPHLRIAVKANTKPRVQARYQERGKRKGNVARYIKRGTGIANYYVAKYTRFALAKAFR